MGLDRLGSSLPAEKKISGDRQADQVQRHEHRQDNGNGCKHRFALRSVRPTGGIVNSRVDSRWRYRLKAALRNQRERRLQAAGRALEEVVLRPPAQGQFVKGAGTASSPLPGSPWEEEAGTKPSPPLSALWY